eukprot:5475060-Pyramimonas_sp.AAC.1
MQPPSKKPRVSIRTIQQAGLRSSVRAIQRAFGSIASEEAGPGVSGPSVVSCTQQYASKLRTPYGYLMEKLRAPLTDGTHVDWTIANPFALVWYLCSISVGFSSLMAQHLANR